MTDETIFATALEKPDAAERSAYLDATCKDDPERRKRIDGLLAAHDKAVGFLERPAVATPDPEHAPTRAYRATETPSADGPTRAQGEGEAEDTDDAVAFLQPPGRPDSLGRIGHYEVLEVLGRGGFGIVFRAFDEKLQRVVAVKVLSPSIAATSPARKRFLREARSAAPIRHENVVLIHDTGEEPLPYLVMEFVPGETLQARLDRTGPLEVPEVLRIGRQVAEGLAAAHEKGLIHRDIKPSNILIDNGPQQVKITDFGLARAADDASLTRSGVVAGTPMYMAPEQARGETLDHRADLFSLGSVLYALLTGHPPFRAPTTLAVLKRVAEEQPRPMREVIPELPEWLCRIVEKLHAKNPADRYQSAREVADVLADCEKQLAAHKELKDFARIPEPKPAPPPRRKHLLAGGVGLALGVLLPLVVLLVGGIWFGRAAVLYATNRGELELLPHEGLVSLIVLRNDEGVFDDDKLHPMVTDWLDLKKPHKLKLPPGKYQLNAGLYPAGTEISQWEVTTADPFGSSRLLVPNQPGHHSAIVTVERGKRVTVRPVVVSLAAIEERNRAAIDGNKLKDLAKAVNDLGSEMEGFVPLFNGKDLSGWKVFPDDRTSWKVENGVLVGSGKPSHLFTERGDFGNFHLRMQTRIKRTPKGGAVGVFARVPFEDPGAILSPFGKENLYKIPVPKLYDDKAAPPDPAPPSYREGPQVVWGVDLKGERTQNKQFPADEWFTHELIVDGKNVTVKTAAGSNTSNSFIAAGAKADSGHIALQLFDDWSVVEFRKVEIKELPAGSPAVPQKAADVLPYLAGNWKVEQENLNPDLPPDKAVLVGYLTYDYVAGGKVLRARGNASGDQSVLLHAYDRGQDRLQLWQAYSNGVNGGPTTGAFNPAGRTLTWTWLSGAGTPQNHEFTFTDPDTFTTHMYRLDEKNNIVRLKNMKFTRIKEPVAIPILPTDPNRPNDMKALDRLAGEWRNEIEFTGVATGGKTISETVRVKARPILGGRFVEMVEDNERHNGSDYTLLWFDETAKQYREWFFTSGGKFMEFAGTWDEKAQTLTWTTPDGTSEGRWEFQGADQRTFRHVSKGPGGNTVFDATGVSRRVTPGFVPLFSGKDLSGWHSTADKFFVTKEGSILANPVQNEYGMLRTTKEYENYELRMLCKPTGQLEAGSKTRGGVGLHATEATEGVSPGRPNPGTTIWLTSGRAPGIAVSGEGNLKDVKKFEATRGPTDGWNELRVVRAGARVTIFYNGDRRWTCDNCPTGKGNIALWAEDGDVYFRDIAIRELPPNPPAPPNAAVQPLRDLVAAKQLARDTAKLRFEAGAGSKIDLLKAEAELSEARIALGDAEGDSAAVVRRLEDLVKQRQEERDLIAERVKVGVDARDVLNQADARLAEAKARLAKVKPPGRPEPAPAPRPKS